MIRRRALVIAALAAGAAATFAPTSVSAQEPPPPRQPFINVPEGCPVQQIADVVFVGTVIDSDYRTVRFRIDQPRAGDLGMLASQVGADFLVDVRYGTDAKYLEPGAQYLIGASTPADDRPLESKVAERPAPLGGDEIIGASETDTPCPGVDDPNLTLRTDGMRVDSGLLTPLLSDTSGILGAVLGAVGLVIGGLFALAALRWLLTGFGRGIDSIARSSTRRQTREAMRPRAR